MKTELPPEHVSTGKSLHLKLYGNGAVKELTGVSAKPSEIARHIIRDGSTFAAMTDHFGWKSTTKTMDTTRTET